MLIYVTSSRLLLYMYVHYFLFFSWNCMPMRKRATLNHKIHLHDAQWHAFYYGRISGGYIDIIQDSLLFFAETCSGISLDSTVSESSWWRCGKTESVLLIYHFDNNSTSLTAQRIRRCHASGLKLDLRLNYRDISYWDCFRGGTELS